MGMDVYGKAPRTEAGKYFRNNVWGWHPLWRYCQQVAPEVTGAVKHGHTNDGDGLTGSGSLVLAKRLQAEIDAGRTAQYAQTFTDQLKATPDEVCWICGGTGYRQSPPVCGPGDKPCNGCDSTGKVRPIDCWYHFSVENVQEFVRFLRDCGGFEIC